MSWWAFLLGIVLGYEGRFLIQRAMLHFHKKFNVWMDDKEDACIKGEENAK